MKIAISGINGFVGSHLSRQLQRDGHQITPLRRGEFVSPIYMQNALTGVETVIHLAGAPLAARWTESYKRELLASRIDTTRLLVDSMRSMAHPPRLFISTSGIGIYPPHVPCDETTTDYADDFLGALAQNWEYEAKRAKDYGIKTVIFRFAVVLGADGGMLRSILPLFRLGLGGIIGDGTQPFSWVHIQDLIAAYQFVITRYHNNGFCNDIFNITSPSPTTNAGFTHALGKVLRRPTVFPVPEFLLRLRFGEGADIMLKGQYVLPRHLSENGFAFAFPDIEGALQDLCNG